MTGRNPEIVRFHEYRFIAGDGLWHADRPVPLPPRALGLLTALLASPGTVVAKRELMDAVWPGTFVTESSLLEAIGLLREALGDDPREPRFIQTVHRRGYRFIAPIAPVSPVSPASPASFFSGPEWRPIVAACVTYAATTVCVALIFAVFGQPRPERPLDLAYGWELPAPQPQLAISHTAKLAWDREGLELAFAVSKAGPFNLISAWQQLPTSWSPDGRLLAFTEIGPIGGADIWVLDVRTGARRAVVRTPHDETWARFSPDGRSIAYMSNESGRWEVYVRPASGDGNAVRLSSDGGAWPAWSDDGHVYFTAGRTDLRVMLDWFSELAARVAS